MEHSITRYELVRPPTATLIRRGVVLGASVIVIVVLIPNPIVLIVCAAFVAFGGWALFKSLNGFVELRPNELVLRGRYWATAAYEQIEGLREPGSNLPASLDSLRKFYMKQPGMEYFRANVDLVFKRPRVVFTLPPWRMRVFPIAIERDPAAFCEDLNSRLSAAASSPAGEREPTTTDGSARHIPPLRSG